MKKFFRDTGILLAFCGAFYLLTVLVNRLEGETETDPTDYSPARKRANEMVHNKDWPAASVEFKKLTEQDPFNGYAWDGYGTCLWQLRLIAINERENLNRSSGSNPQQEIELDRQISDLSDQSRQILMRVKKFARYRYTALLRLAALECERGNYDDAMDFLEEFVGRGYQTKLGLQWIESFGSSDSVSLYSNSHGSIPGLIIPRFRPSAPPPVSKYAKFEYNGDLSRLRVPTGTETGLHQEPRFWDLVRRESGISAEF